MDPNANLAKQRSIVARMLERFDTEPSLSGTHDQACDGQRLAELVEALDDWIRNGGCLPNAWTANRRSWVRR